MMGTTKILFISADPTNAARLRLGEEMREVRERLQLSKFRDAFVLIERHCVRPGDLTQAIFDTEPDIIHFSGHGSSTGSLLFENEDRQAFPISPEALESVFELFSDKIFCVVLNACFSKKQAEAIARKIQYVVGMRGQIGDTAAIAFSVGFYKALINSRSIEDAFKFGLAEIQLTGNNEHFTPVLVTNPSMRRGLIVKSGTMSHAMYVVPPMAPGRIRIQVSDSGDGIYALADPNEYSDLGGLLDELYVMLLPKIFSPYTYGERWVLAKERYDDMTRVIAPLEWAASPHQSIATVAPEWQRKSSLSSQGLVAGSEWSIRALQDDMEFCGIATNYPEIVALAEEGPKQLYSVRRALLPIELAAFKDLDESIYAYHGVFYDEFHKYWGEGQGEGKIFVDPPADSDRARRLENLRGWNRDDGS